MVVLVATLSRFADHLVGFCESVREVGYDGPIVVADDGVEDLLQFKRFHPIQFIPCRRRPFVFARNANNVFKEFPDEDIFLVNDDARLRSPLEGITKIARMPWRPGIISAGLRSPIVYDYQKAEKNVFYRDVGYAMLTFVAVCLPAALRREIGLLDERFDGYGFEDNDYCTRAATAGFVNAVVPSCIVDHPNPSASFHRTHTPEEYGSVIEHNLQLWVNKSNKDSER